MTCITTATKSTKRCAPHHPPLPPPPSRAHWQVLEGTDRLKEDWGIHVKSYECQVAAQLFMCATSHHRLTTLLPEHCRQPQDGPRNARAVGGREGEARAHHRERGRTTGRAELQRRQAPPHFPNRISLIFTGRQAPGGHQPERGRSSASHQHRRGLVRLALAPMLLSAHTFVSRRVHMFQRSVIEAQAQVNLSPASHARLLHAHTHMHPRAHPPAHTHTHEQKHAIAPLTSPQAAATAVMAKAHSDAGTSLPLLQPQNLQPHFPNVQSQSRSLLPSACPLTRPLSCTLLPVVTCAHMRRTRHICPHPLPSHPVC